MRPGTQLSRHETEKKNISFRGSRPDRLMFGATHKEEDMPRKSDLHVSFRSRLLSTNIERGKSHRIPRSPDFGRMTVDKSNNVNKSRKTD